MRRIVFAAVPPIQVLDLTGPYEVFARCGGYSVELVTSERESIVTTSSGLSVAGARRYASVRGTVDTLLIPGGDGAEDLVCDTRFVAWVARMAGRVRRIGSICTGAFVLAEAGVLDGKRATTHWAWCDRLASMYPGTALDPDPIFIRDGAVYSSAGVTAGIDLALALVEEDHGRRRAREIARDLVLYLRRSGGQSQFSTFLHREQSAMPRIENLIAWIPDHLDQDLRVEALASRCAMSPRHFARTFAAETGTTPAQFVLQARVLAARSQIEDTDAVLKTVASSCGFRSLDSMRRAFLRVLSVTPAQYREGFGHRRQAFGFGRSGRPQLRPSVSS